MVNNISIIFIKFLDNLISSSKSIHTHELNTFKVFCLSVVKAAMFLLIITEVSKSSTLWMAIATISAGVGSAIPVWITNRHKNKIEDTWRYNIVCFNLSKSVELVKRLRSKNIEVIANENTIGLSGNIISVKAIAHSSKDSKSIIDCLDVGQRVTIDKNVESFIKK